MANPLSANLKTGTLGELLVQIRLLQYGVQSAPPLKDTGNDLIALKGNVCRAIQIKTLGIGVDVFNLDGNELKRDFDILALVNLRGENEEIYFDKSEIYLLWKADKPKTYYTLRELELSGWELCKGRVDGLFSPELEGGIISFRQVR